MMEMYKHTDIGPQFLLFRDPFPSALYLNVHWFYRLLCVLLYEHVKSFFLCWIMWNRSCQLLLLICSTTVNPVNNRIRRSNKVSAFNTYTQRSCWRQTIFFSFQIKMPLSALNRFFYLYSVNRVHIQINKQMVITQ